MENAITILDHLQFDCPTAQQKLALLGMSDFVKETNKDDFFIDYMYLDVCKRKHLFL